ncbi:MAG: BamA/TamA family outer membrane protein [Calditrichaceae bacterium]
MIEDKKPTGLPGCMFNSHTFKIIFILLITGLYHQARAEIKIDKIYFNNNNYFSNGDLKNVIHSEEGDTYEPRLLKLDKILLKNFYRQHGFLDAAITDSVITISDREKINIQFYVSEGQHYYYGGLRMHGNADISSQVISEQFKNLELYESFKENKVNEAVKRVENIYYNSGKPFIEIKTNYLVEDDSLIMVVLDITENQTVYINKVEYYGLNQVKKFLIRRELAIKKEEKYNREAIEKSQENIYSTGLFKYVRLEIEPINDNPGQVILKILVQERDPIWIGFRLGLAHEQQAYYSNKLEFTVQGGHRNLFGTARNISLQITPSVTYDFDSTRFHNLDNKISLTFVEPWIGNTRTPGTFNLSYEQYRPPQTIDFNVLATSFGIKRSAGKHADINAAIIAKIVDQLGEGKIDESYQKKLDLGKSQVYSLNFYYKRDKRKNLFNPTNSSYTDLSLAFSYSTGRDENNNKITNRYITLISSWQRYQPFRPKVLGFKRWDFTLASRLKMGAIYELGGNQAIPINDRFFAGGASSVRGYKEQSLGPVLYTENGKVKQAAGGNLLYLGNIEVRMPIVWIVVLETFFDTGYVWPEISAFRPSDIKASTGMGIAFLTPLGPIRVDYGYKLIRTDTDHHRTNFTLVSILRFNRKYLFH